MNSFKSTGRGQRILNLVLKPETTDKENLQQSKDPTFLPPDESLITPEDLGIEAEPTRSDWYSVDNEDNNNYVVLSTQTSPSLLRSTAVEESLTIISNQPVNYRNEVSRT